MGGKISNIIHLIFRTSVCMRVLRLSLDIVSPYEFGNKDESMIINSVIKECRFRDMRRMWYNENRGMRAGSSSVRYDRVR